MPPLAVLLLTVVYWSLLAIVLCNSLSDLVFLLLDKVLLHWVVVIVCLHEFRQLPFLLQHRPRFFFFTIALPQFLRLPAIALIVFFIAVRVVANNVFPIFGFILRMIDLERPAQYLCPS